MSPEDQEDDQGVKYSRVPLGNTQVQLDVILMPLRAFYPQVDVCGRNQCHCPPPRSEFDGMSRSPEQALSHILSCKIEDYWSMCAWATIIQL